MEIRQLLESASHSVPDAAPAGPTLPSPLTLRCAALCSSLQGNAARHINHSCLPNCYTLKLIDVHTREGGSPACLP